MSGRPRDLDELFAEARAALSPSPDDRERNFALLAGKLGAAALAGGAAGVSGSVAATAAATTQGAAAGLGAPGASMASAATAGSSTAGTALAGSAITAEVAAGSATAGAGAAGKVAGAWAAAKGVALAKIVVPLAVAGAVAAPLVRSHWEAPPLESPAATSAPSAGHAPPVAIHRGPSEVPPASEPPAAATGADRSSIALHERPAPPHARGPSAAAPRPIDAARLADEARLVERMARADRESNDDSVLALAREHEARFADGVLIEERRALATIARCRRGGDRAGLLGAFRALHPRSPSLPRVSDACAEEK